MRRLLAVRPPSRRLLRRRRRLRHLRRVLASASSPTTRMNSTHDPGLFVHPQFPNSRMALPTHRDELRKSFGNNTKFPRLRSLPPTARYDEGDHSTSLAFDYA